MRTAVKIKTGRDTWRVLFTRFGLRMKPYFLINALTVGVIHLLKGEGYQKDDYLKMFDDMWEEV